MTKAESQARAYGQELRERQGLASKAGDCYGPSVRDFIFGEGIFSEDEQVKMNLRVAGKIAEKASKAFMEQFAKEFNTFSGQVVVELDLPSPPKKNPMPHAWSSDPARDAKVRMQEDGRTNPYPTLAECLREEGAVSPVSVSEHLETVRKVQLDFWNQRDRAVTAAARERDRADEARARYQKRWRERGKTIAKLQARLSERKQNAPNTSLRKWSEALEDRHATLTVEFRQAVVDGKYLRSLVNDYEDRVGELNMKVSRLEGDLDLAIQSHSNATERRLEAEARVIGLKAESEQLAHERDKARKERDTLLESEAWGVNCKPAPATFVVAGKGWLTPTEQEAIMFLIANRSQFAPQTPHEERRNAACRVCHALLARETPPEVVLPRVYCHGGDGEPLVDLEDVRAALAAAGVPWKEVGK